jgi:prepilin-type N-terminal cleavage/methylation domain-containing protein
MNIMSLKFSNRYKENKGFTLIELMITIGIFVFMTAVLLSKYNSFYSGTIFKNLAYDIALTIRQAQTYGISVKVADSSSSSNFNEAYGVHVELLVDPDFKKFRLSTFVPSGSVFTEKDIEQVYNLKNGARLFYPLVSKTGGPVSTTQVRFVNIIFRRPNPEAIICAKVAAIDLYDCSYNWTRLILRAPDGTSRTVEVNSAGQIKIGT